MTDRRRFLSQLGRAAGLAAGASLLDTRALAAGELVQTFRRLGDDRSARQLAEEYLLGPEVVYLNHASIGTIPRTVLQARQRYVELCETNPWLYMWEDVWEASREEVRAKAAGMIGCAPTDLAITHNTTEGFNTLAHGLPLGPGDEVLFSTLNHPGASLPWFHTARTRGYQVRQFAFPIDRIPAMTAQDVVETYLTQITPATRVLVFSHVDNTVGLRYPVRELTRAARARGVEFVAVDGAQSVGMIPVDVIGDDVDFYAASPHKWLQAPKGLGLFYVHSRVRDVLSPMWVTWGQTRWKGSARIFEDYGTRNLPELITLGDAIDFQLRLGSDRKEARYRAMWTKLKTAVEAEDRLRWRSPGGWSLGASLVAIEVVGVPSGELFNRLHESHGMVFRAFSTGDFTSSRISPNLNTPESHLDLFLEQAMAAARG